MPLPHLTCRGVGGWLLPGIHVDAHLEASPFLGAQILDTSVTLSLCCIPVACFAQIMCTLLTCTPSWAICKSYGKVFVPYAFVSMIRDGASA